MSYRNTEFAKDLALNVKSAWCDRRYCDITVKVGDIEIPAHKLVLSAHSKYFQTAFDENDELSYMEMNDVDQDATEACIEYMYSGEIIISEETTADVLKVASLLIMTGLFDFCVNYMQDHMTPENCLQIRKLSYKYQIKILRKSANTFASQNLHKLSTQNPEYLELPKEDIIMFMYMQPHHNISYDAAMCWLKFDFEERRRFVPELMKSVKFKRFTDNFTNHVIASEDLCLLDQKSVIKFGKKSPVFGYEAVMKWVKSDVERRMKFLPQMLECIDLDLLPESYVQSLMTSSDYKHFDKGSVMKMLIGQKSSVVVFEAVMAWVKHDTPARSSLLPTMLRIVDFSKFTDAYIRQTLTSKDLKILNKKSLIQLIRSQNSPLLAYNSAIKWVKSDFQNRKMLLKEVLQNIRLEHLPWKFLDKTVRAQLVEIESVDSLNLLLQVMTTLAQDHRKQNIIMFDKKEQMIKGYDPQAGQWTNMQFNKKFQKFTALVLHEQLYVLQGRSLHRLEYDVTQTPIWREMASMNEDRGVCPRVTVKAGYLYATGGASSSNTAEYYDPLRDKWTYIACMKVKRCQHAVVAVNDQLYAIGGWDGSSRLNSVERFENSAWSFVTPMNKTRSNAAAVEHNELIYVLGGNGSDKTDTLMSLQSVTMYDPVCDLWTALPKLKVPRFNFCACVLDDKLYGVGGDDCVSDKDKTIEVFDFERSNWKVIEKMKDVLLEQTSVVIKIEEGFYFEENKK